MTERFDFHPEDEKKTDRMRSGNETDDNDSCNVFTFLSAEKKRQNAKSVEKTKRFGLTVVH